MSSEHKNISQHLEFYGITIASNYVEELLKLPDSSSCSEELIKYNNLLSRHIGDNPDVYADIANRYGYLLIFLALTDYKPKEVWLTQSIIKLHELLEVEDQESEVEESTEAKEDQDQQDQEPEPEEDISTLVSRLFDRAHREQVNSFRFDLVDLGRALPEGQQRISLSRCVQIFELVKLIVNTGMYGDWIVTEVNSTIIQIDRLSPNYYEI